VKKSIGELIDELSIVNIKLFFTIEEKHQAHVDGKGKLMGELAVKEDQLNGRRSALRNAINEELGEDFQEIKVGGIERYQK